MSRVTLALGVHNHQPVGNFGSVFAHACERAYRPFFDAVARVPEVKWNLHFSGPLLEWMADERPDLMQAIAAGTAEGRFECVGSGFYEPILASIPPRDARAQLDRMRDYLAARTGRAPQGIWLTERIWEPSLPALLAPAGVRYVLVDDHHFFYAGHPAGTMTGYYTVERHGESIAVFPIDRGLRYRIPFSRSIDELLDGLKRLLDTHPDGCVVSYFDDGEKFGVWPRTFDWVYTKGWLDRFLNALAANGDWLTTAHFGDIVAATPPAGRFALPTASYVEMTEWCLPARETVAVAALRTWLGEQGRRAEAESYLKGGVWDQFLVKYEESNRLHKRMLDVSARVARAAAERPGDAAVARATTHLQRAQCNDAYWHGLFGGLYLPFLRQSLHRELIAADRELNAAGAARPPAAAERDFSRSGEREVVVQTPAQVLVWRPFDGGTLYLWDDLVTGFSYSDTLTRRFEAYHTKVADAHVGTHDDDAAKSAHDIVLAKEAGLADKLVYDACTRLTGRTAVWAADTDLARLHLEPPADIAGLSGARFALIDAQAHGPGVRVTMTGAAGGRRIERTIDVPGVGAGFVWRDRTTAPDDAPAGALAARSVEITLHARGDIGRYVVVNGDTGLPAPADARPADRFDPGERFSAGNVHTLRFVDHSFGYELMLTVEPPATVAYYPVETVSNSEAGFEAIYQGSSMAVLHPETETDVRIAFSSRRLRP